MRGIFDKDWSCYDCTKVLNAQDKREFIIPSKGDKIEATKLFLCDSCLQNRNTLKAAKVIADAALTIKKNLEAVKADADMALTIKGT